MIIKVCAEDVCHEVESGTSGPKKKSAEEVEAEAKAIKDMTYVHIFNRFNNFNIDFNSFNCFTVHIFIYEFI